MSLLMFFDNQEARKKEFPIIAAITKLLLYSHCALMIFVTILTVDEKIKVADVQMMHRNNTSYNDNLFAIPTPISFPFMATNCTNHLGEHSEPIACDLQQAEFLAKKFLRTTHMTSFVILTTGQELVS